MHREGNFAEDPIFANPMSANKVGASFKGTFTYQEPQRYMLPNKLKLMGREIYIQYVDKEHVNNMGMYIEKKNLIQIDNSMHPAVQERTLIHEVMHSILIDLGEQDLNNNEGFVERIANMVHLFIKENKEIIV